MSVDKKAQLSEKQLVILESELKKKRKSMPLAYILLIFLGFLGVHKFYLGKTKQGVLYVLLSVVGFISLVVGEFTGLISFGASGTTLFTFGLVCAGVLGVMLIIDLFTTPGQVRQFNETVESRIIDQLLQSGTEGKTNTADG